MDALETTIDRSLAVNGKIREERANWYGLGRLSRDIQETQKYPQFKILTA